MKIRNFIKSIYLTVLLFVMLSALYNFNTVFAIENSKKQSIEDGIYIIKSALNEKYVLDIECSSKSNGANLELWTNGKTDNQKFNIKYIGNDVYSISPIHSNKYIDVAGNSKQKGANVLQWENHGGDNQKWLIKDAGNGYYNIISKSNGLYLDIPQSNSKDGANIQVWEKNNEKNQMFKFEKQIIGSKTINDGIYSIKVASNSNVLDVGSSSMVDGGNIGFWENSSTANQKFNVTYIGNGYYTLSATHSGKYVKVSEQGNKTNVLQEKYTEIDNQKWIIKDAGNGWYNIISKYNGLYLTQNSSGNAEVSKDNNSNNQKFKFEVPTPLKGEKTINDGTYIITSAKNKKEAFDIPSSSKNDGTILGLWEKESTANQKFNVTYIGNGYYTIKAQHSGKAIQVAGGSKQLNTNIEQKTYNSSDEQKWIIKDAGNGYFNIISKSSELYINVNDKNELNLYNENNQDSQKFKFETPKAMEAKWVINDGTYVITSELSKKYVFDIPSSSKKDGEILELWQNGKTANQRFYVKHIGNGYYTIQAEHSEKALGIAGGNKELNTKIEQKTYNSSDEQKWILKDAGNGYYNIISKSSELCMEVTNGSATNGTKIQMYNLNNTKSQRFKFYNPNNMIDIDDNKYPGYMESIERLMDTHPNWNFELLYTGLKFSDAVSGEGRVHSRNLVETSNTGEWICSTCGTKLYDNGWYCASEKAIAYYLDPRNFLDEVNVFQFLDVNSYTEDSCTIDGIIKKLSNTFLEDYVNDVNNACKNTDVNPYYIIARLLQEQGTQGTQIGKGMDGGDGKTYYNPFNIGASGDGWENIYANALARAKKEGWDSMQKAIEGGIAFCKKNWLENYQNTLYQNKFDIDTRNGTNLYEHQYMQNLLGAYSEARTLQGMYYNTGKLDSNFTFIIPVYENMDSKISEKPSNDFEMYPMNVQITGNDVRLRKEANTNSQILKEIQKGTILLSIQRGINSNWQKVITKDGTIGYVSGTYLKQIDDIKTCNYTKKVKTNNGTGCYIRYGPGLNAPKMKALPDGTNVTVIDDSTYKNIDGYNWYRIVLSDGIQAFMPENYLK